MTSIGIAALMLAGAASAPAAAQSAGSRQTREFVRAAGESDSFETMAARTALAESHDPQVLAFARQMIDDHGGTSRALTDATASVGLDPPPMIAGAGQSPFLAALQSLRGRAFDQAYWRQQALAHRSALAVQRQYAASGDSPAVRRAAATAVPLIEAHLAMAERMSAATADQ